MNFAPRVSSRSLLLSVAAFAMIWAVARATIQSITIDEAFTYVVFVWKPHYWRAASNNHMLNSMLMGLFSRMFGISQLTVRLPALIGAALYISATYRLCRLLSRSSVLQLALFLCLVFNPFIFDYLVAARGYGLALGFLMWAIIYSAQWHLEQDSSPSRSCAAVCAVSSACLGFSIAANLAFTIVDSVAIVAIFLFAWSQRTSDYARLLTACVVPGAIVILALPAYAILHWPKGELFYGSTSLRETFGSIIEASLYRTSFNSIKPAVFPLVGLTGVSWMVFLMLRQKGKEVTDAHTKWLARFSLTLAATTTIAVAIHWAAFQLFGLLLPKDRTAIFLFPLLVTAVGALAAIPAPSGAGRYLQHGLVGALLLMASYFLLCSRLSYFKEWQWDADVKEAYSVLSCLDRVHHVTNIASGWPYVMALNFYRLSTHSEIREILDESLNSTPRAEIFVLDTLHNSGIAEKKGLRVFYHGRSTDLVIAATPDFEQTMSASPCLLRSPQ